MTPNLEDIILNNLIHAESYTRKVLPHLKPEYFQSSHKVVYELILQFVGKYNKLPNSAVIDIEYRKSPDANRYDTNEACDIISSLSSHEIAEYDWLVDSTEKWCKDRAVHLAIMEAVGIIDGKDKDKAEGSIPSILSKALSVTFDTNVGHDYLENSESRYDFYHKTEDKIEFDLEMFNIITGGGIPRKTLNIILAGCVHPETLVRVKIGKKILS